MREPRFRRAAVLALSLAASAPAQPLLLLDTAFVHGADAATRPEAGFPLRAGLPADWSVPVDYGAGTAHFRLEVRGKPTGTAIRYQPCLERGASRACAPAQLLADSGGGAAYSWSRALPEWTPALSFAARPERFVLVLQDAYGRPIVPAAAGGPAPAWAGQPFLSLYYPMSVRFSAAVAPKGAAFPGWDGLIPTAVGKPPGYVGSPSGRGGGFRRGADPGAGGAMAAWAAGGYRDARGRRLAGRAE